MADSMRYFLILTVLSIGFLSMVLIEKDDDIAGPENMIEKSEVNDLDGSEVSYHIEREPRHEVGNKNPEAGISGDRSSQEQDSLGQQRVSTSIGIVNV